MFLLKLEVAVKHNLRPVIVYGSEVWRLKETRM